MNQLTDFFTFVTLFFVINSLSLSLSLLLWRCFSFKSPFHTDINALVKLSQSIFEIDVLVISSKINEEYNNSNKKSFFSPFFTAICRGHISFFIGNFVTSFVYRVTILPYFFFCNCKIVFDMKMAIDIDTLGEIVV